MTDVAQRFDVPIIKATIVAGLVALARELGIPAHDWFAGLRLEAGQFDLAAPISISYRQAAQVVRRALRAFPEGIGLMLGQRQNVGNFGLLGLAMMTAPRFGDALGVALRYAAITGAMVDLELQPQSNGDVAVLARMRTPDPELEPFLCEELFASSLMLCRGLIGPQFRTSAVELSYPAPRYAAQYTELFGDGVRFGRPDNRVVVAASWLATPMPAHDSASAQKILALCSEQMPAGYALHETVAAVTRLLRRRLPENPKLGDIAADLHLSERTLRRQLAAANTGFQELHDRIRYESAAALLRDPKLSIAHVSTAVGFRDPREFRRAFKRWGGMAPGQSRKRETSDRE